MIIVSRAFSLQLAVFYPVPWACAETRELEILIIRILILTQIIFKYGIFLWVVT